ncbi:hypothetical protein AgCh_010001 [Apium graveolens]
MKFIELLAPLENIPEDLALGHFLMGLREDIRAEVRLQGPMSVDQAMELAIMIKDKNRLNTVRKGDIKGVLGSTRSFSLEGSSTAKENFSSYSSPSKAPSSYSQSIFSTAHSSVPPAKPMGEIRRLSEKELQYKREKGLCFRCDDKWVVGHKCRRKELSVLLSQGEDEDGEFSLDSPQSQESKEHNSDEVCL